MAWVPRKSFEAVRERTAVIGRALGANCYWRIGRKEGGAGPRVSLSSASLTLPGAQCQT